MIRLHNTNVINFQVNKEIDNISSELDEQTLKVSGASNKTLLYQKRYSLIFVVTLCRPKTGFCT